MLRLHQAIRRLKAPTAVLGTLFASVAVFLFGVRHVAHFTVDDAGITYAYARHLAEGEGLVAVVGGAVVEGYSNPSWVLLLAVVHRLGFDVPVAAKLLGTWLGFGAVLLGMAAVQQIEGRSWKQARARDVLVPAIVGLCPEAIFWLPSGLENGLFSLLLMGMVLLDLREARRPLQIPYSAALAVAVALTRPEGIIYGAAIGAIKLVDALARRGRWRAFSLFTLTFLIGIGVYHAWHAAVFALPLPNTYYAKAPGISAEKLAAGWAYFRHHVEGSDAVWLMPLALVGALRHVRSKAPLLAIIAAATSFTCITGGDWMPFGRFFSPTVLPIAVLATLGLRDLARAARHLTRRIRLGAEPMAALGALALALSWAQHQDVRLERIRKRGWCHYCNRIADLRGIQKVRTRLNIPVASLLIHDFGAASWTSDETFTPMDLLGLCDLTIARTHSAYARRPRSTRRVMYQVFFHEQDQPPTFLYFPESWWPDIGKSTEVLRGTYRLPKRYLGKNHRRDALFAVHRRVFLDYFPPVPRFELRDLDDRLRLLGMGVQGKVRPGETLDLVLVVLRKKSMRSRRVSIRARLRAGSQPSVSSPVALFGDMTSLLRQWEPGEPYAVETEITVPNVPGEPEGLLELDVGVSHNGHPWTWTPVTSLSVGEERAFPAHPRQRFPTNLPSPRSETLASLSREVSALVARRERDRDVRTMDPGLANRLEREAKHLEAQGQPEQAYLAYVLATKANRREAVRWVSSLWRLRPLATNERVSLELALLRKAYATGDDVWVQRLAHLYLRRGAVERAKYFTDRVRDSAARTALQRARRQADLAGPETWEDFEAPTLPPGWAMQGSGFAVQTVGLDDPPCLRGQHGQRVLSSLRRGNRRLVGSVTSAPIPPRGALSFLVAGSNRGVRVELLVDGRVVRTTTGPGSTQLTPVLWSLERTVGREARLLVVDDSPKSYVVVDDLMLWE